MARDELDLFYSLIKLNQCKNIVEIGVWSGESTQMLCKAAATTQGHVHGFDLWDTHGLRNQFHHRYSKKTVEKRLHANGLANFSLYQLDTKRNRQQLIDIIQLKCNPIDFCFIDGCHSYEGIHNDFFAIYPFLSTVSIVAFHDTLKIDSCREFILHLRSKYYDGTYDIIDFPYGGGERRVGITLLVKRCYHKVNQPMDEVCNLTDTRTNIINNEKTWFEDQVK